MPNYIFALSSSVMSRRKPLPVRVLTAIVGAQVFIWHLNERGKKPDGRWKGKERQIEVGARRGKARHITSMR